MPIEDYPQQRDIQSLKQKYGRKQKTEDELPPPTKAAKAHKREAHRTKMATRTFQERAKQALVEKQNRERAKSETPRRALASQDPAVPDVRLIAAHQEIRELTQRLEDEQKLRVDAENRTETLKATYLVPTLSTDSKSASSNEIIKTLNQLDIDYSIVTYNIDKCEEIPKPTRTELAKFLHNAVKHGISQARDQVNRLINHASAVNDSHESAAAANSKAAVLSVTKQIQNFNRQNRLPQQQSGTIKSGSAEKSDTTTANNFTWETSQLVAAESLGVDELLAEVKVAAEMPIRDATIVDSLREELRICKASRWKAEKHEAELRRELEVEQRRVRLAVQDIQNVKLQASQSPQMHDSQDLQPLRETYDNLILKLDQCHKRGEERRIEIQRLKKLLKVRGNDPKPPSQPKPGDEPFTRQEVRALYDFLEDYMRISTQYQQIIMKLEDQLRTLSVHLDLTKLSLEERTLLEPPSSTLEQLDECLQTENSHLKSQILRMTTELAENVEKTVVDEEHSSITQVQHLNATITKLTANVQALDAENTKLISTITNINTKLKIQRTKFTRLAAQVDDLNNKNKTILTDILGTQFLPHPVDYRSINTVAEAVKYLQEQYHLERSSFENYLGVQQPVFDKLKADFANEKINNTHLQGEIKILQKAIKDSQDGKDNEAMRARVKDLTRKLNERTAERDEAEVRAHNAEKQRDIVQKLQNDQHLLLTKTLSDLAETEKKLADYLEHPDSDAEAQRFALEREGLRAQLKNMTKHYTDATEQLQDLTAQHVDLTTSYDSSVATVRALRAQLESTPDVRAVEDQPIAQQLQDMTARYHDTSEQLQAMTTKYSTTKIHFKRATRWIQKNVEKLMAHDDCQATLADQLDLYNRASDNATDITTQHNNRTTEGNISQRQFVDKVEKDNDVSTHSPRNPQMTSDDRYVAGQWFNLFDDALDDIIGITQQYYNRTAERDDFQKQMDEYHRLYDEASNNLAEVTTQFNNVTAERNEVKRQSAASFDIHNQNIDAPPELTAPSDDRCADRDALQRTASQLLLSTEQLKNMTTQYNNSQLSLQSQKTQLDKVTKELNDVTARYNSIKDDGNDDSLAANQLALQKCEAQLRNLASQFHDVEEQRDDFKRQSAENLHLYNSALDKLRDKTKLFDALQGQFDDLVGAHAQAIGDLANTHRDLKKSQDALLITRKALRDCKKKCRHRQQERSHTPVGDRRLSVGDRPGEVTTFTRLGSPPANRSDLEDNGASPRTEPLYNSLPFYDDSVGTPQGSPLASPIGDIAPRDASPVDSPFMPPQDDPPASSIDDTPSRDDLQADPQIMPHGDNQQANPPVDPIVENPILHQHRGSRGNSVVSDDTPAHTPGGSRRRPRPGQRLRREIRAAKRDALEWWPDIRINPKSPKSPS